MKSTVATTTRRLVLSSRNRLLTERSIRSFSSSNKNSSSNDYLWHAATFAAFGLSFVGVRYALKNLNLDSDEDDGVPQVDGIEPAAEVTSKVYFDISVDKHPAG